jgi:16S rRNA (uracil1498-N3)-methyltransferase
MHHRIFVERIEPRLTVTGDEFHHSVRVVRLREGEPVEVFDRSGRMAEGVVEAIRRDEAEIRIDTAIASRESPLTLHLAMAIIQPERFELVLQKATELGVRSIIPMITERVEVRRERYAGKGDRWERIVLEAVRQSGRSIPPHVAEPMRFADVLGMPQPKVLFEAEREPGQLAGGTELMAMIGPEGGWSNAELDEAEGRGAVFQRLGPRRLRAETAALAAVTLLTSRFGDL